MDHFDRTRLSNIARLYQFNLTENPDLFDVRFRNKELGIRSSTGKEEFVNWLPTYYSKSEEELTFVRPELNQMENVMKYLVGLEDDIPKVGELPEEEKKPRGILDQDKRVRIFTLLNDFDLESLSEELFFIKIRKEEGEPEDIYRIKVEKDNISLNIKSASSDLAEVHPEEVDVGFDILRNMYELAKLMLLPIS